VDKSLKNPLARLSARIVDLEAQRAALESALTGLNPPPPLPPATDWEPRLSAARAVDALTGADTVAAVEAQRAADAAAREQQARKADCDALQATQTRLALSTLGRDLEAATALLQRELATAARGRLATIENRYHMARAAWLNAAEDLAGALALCNRETEAHQLLRTVGTTGDTMTVIGRRANQLRLELLEEPDHA
jgi:hypothetical protein